MNFFSLAIFTTIMVVEGVETHAILFFAPLREKGSWKLFDKVRGYDNYSDMESSNH